MSPIRKKLTSADTKAAPTVFWINTDSMASGRWLERERTQMLPRRRSEVALISLSCKAWA